MRRALFVMLATAACGNGLVQIENIVPIDGPLLPTMFVDVGIDDFDADKDDPLIDSSPSLEVDTSRAFCLGTTDDSCLQEPFAPHYALVTIANHNEEDPGGGVTGIAQIDRYTVEVNRLEDAPEIKGFSGLLGVSIKPQTRKTFAVVLMGMDGKAEFRNAGASTARRYAIKYTFDGPGGLILEGGATVLVGEFDKCAKDYTPISFCGSF